jgi:hypothetical protein
MLLIPGGWRKHMETAEIKLADPLLTTAIVAAMLMVSEDTLIEWRSRRGHPLKFLKLGYVVRYKLSDVISFLEHSRSARSSESPRRPRRSLKREASKLEPKA